MNSSIALLKKELLEQWRTSKILILVLGFLFCLACVALPEPWRLRGGYTAAVAVCFACIGGVGLYAYLRAWPLKPLPSFMGGFPAQAVPGGVGICGMVILLVVWVPV